MLLPEPALKSTPNATVMLVPPQNDLLIEDNQIFNSTNSVSGSGGAAILVGGSAATTRAVIRGNTIRDSVVDAIRLQPANNIVVEGNRIVNANTLGVASRPAIWVGAFDVACTNVLVQNNTIVASPNSAFGIKVGDSTGAGQRKVWLLNNKIEDVGTALIGNFAGGECMVDGTWPLGPTNPATLISGRYTNNVWDRVVGIPGATTTILRTNLLPNAALSNYFPWPITIWDKGTNASGTNIWIQTVAGQLIRGATNAGETAIIATDNGSVTLAPDGEGNWRIINAYP